MNRAVRGFGLAASLALVFNLALPPQAEAQSIAAYVYIQIDGPQGAVYGFNSSSTGKLTAIPGAPWKPTGQIIGSNKTQFITLGEDNIHSYAVESNGAIGSALEQNPYTDYAGGECGTGSTAMNNAVLDHTGKYVYIVLQTSNGVSGCASVQSFNINRAGAFDGVGDAVLSGDSNVLLPSILGNESFAYANTNDDNNPIGFARENSGALTPLQLQVTTPAYNGGLYTPAFPDASPTAKFVVLHLFPNDANPFQLGSFAVNAQGNLTTTNTSSNMPTSGLIGASSTFSPSGNFYVLYADGGANSQGQQVPGGIEIYNFNGAAPLTLYKKLLTGTSIDQVAWDNENHLYAISKSANMLYVYTVTPASITQDTAWSIGGPAKMIVVSSGSGSSSPTTQFSDPLIDQTGTLAVGGQVTIDTSGNTTVEVTGQAASQTYNVEFCPGSNAQGSSFPACFNITTLSTGSSGSGSATVMFPKTGNWAGEFLVNNSSGATVVESGLFPNLGNETYVSTLVPESTTNAGAITGSKGQNPLGSGSVSYSNGTLLFTVNGAAASASYMIDQTEGAELQSSNSYVIGTLTTNASGDGSKSIGANPNYGDMFELEGGSGAGFIGGFSIP